MCARIAEGESLEAILRDPGMPCTTGFNDWKRKDPDLAGIFEAARAQGARRGGRPGRGRYTPELAAKVCERLCEAQGLDAVCSQPGMPSSATVYKWARDIPEFALALGRARQVQADRLFERVWKIAREAHEGNWRSAKLKVDTLKWLTARLAPDRYGPADFVKRMAEVTTPVVVEVVRFSDMTPEEKAVQMGLKPPPEGEWL